MNQGMETRWGSYVKVAANFAANNVQIRLRVARFLAKNEWFDGGGGELGAAARLVYWACNSSATLLHMHIVAEAGRAIVTPAIHWLEEKDGRRLLEFPAYLRRVLSRLAALSDGQVDDFPETCAYAKSAGIGLDVVRDRLGLAAKILSSYIINRIGYMFRVPLSHVLLVDPSRRVRKSYAAKLLVAHEAGQFQGLPDPTGILRDADLMREVKRVALTGDESEALRTCLEVTIGRNPGNTSGDEWRVKAMRGVHRSAINAGGLSPALRSKTCVFNTDEAIKEFLNDARLLERLRLDRERAQRAADLAVVAAEAAADTKEEETEDLDAAIIAAAEREAAAAEVLCDARAGKAAARDGRDAARAAATGAAAPAPRAPAGAVAAGPAARPRAAPVPRVAVSTFLRPVVWAVAKALTNVYMDRDGKDANLSLVAFVDKFLIGELPAALARIVADRPAAPVEGLAELLRRRAEGAAGLSYLSAFAASLKAPAETYSSDCPLCQKDYQTPRQHMAAHLQSKHLTYRLHALVNCFEEGDYLALDLQRLLGFCADEPYKSHGPRVTLADGEDVEDLFNDADTYGAENELWGLVETGAAMIAVQLAFEADPVAAARAAVPRHALLAATQDSTAAARAPALLARQLGSIETEEPPSPAPSIEAQAPLQPPPPPRS